MPPRDVPGLGERVPGLGEGAPGHTHARAQQTLQGWNRRRELHLQHTEGVAITDANSRNAAKICLRGIQKHAG